MSNDARSIASRWQPSLPAWLLAVLLALATSTAAQDGNFDTAWGEGGRRLVDIGDESDHGFALLIQPDSKLLLAGTCIVNGLPRLCATRLLTNGSYDPGFGAGLGYAIYDAIPFVSYFGAAASTADGRSVLTGFYDIADDQGAIVARLTAAGDLDASAAQGVGYLRFDYLPTIAAPYSQINAIAVLPDGKVLVSGSAETRRAGVDNWDFAVARLRTDLSGFDLSFGNAGVQLVPFDLTGPSGGDHTNQDVVTTMAVQADDKILLGGFAMKNGQRQSVLVRLDANGAFDPSFGNGGRVELFPGIATHHSVSALAVDRQGRIIVTGDHYGGAVSGYDFYVARRTDTGAADTSFGNFGARYFGFNYGGNHNDFVNAISLQLDGKILVSGIAFNSYSSNHFVLARLLPSGVLDSSFGKAGRVKGIFGPRGQVDYFDGFDNAKAIASGNGGLMVAGYGRAQGGDDTSFGIAKLQLDLVFTDGFQP